MKLLDMTAEQASDTLCAISPLMENIVTDKKLEKIIQKEINRDDMTRIEIGFELADRLFTSTPILLGAHRADVFGILAAVNQTSIEEVSKQPIRDILTQLKELFADEEMRSFFTSFLPMEATE